MAKYNARMRSEDRERATVEVACRVLSEKLVGADARARPTRSHVHKGRYAFAATILHELTARMERTPRRTSAQVGG